jgi:CheY-like chemotaxis protein
VLRRAGYDVTLAPAHSRALEIAANHQFDLIISDIALPDGSGVDLLRQIRARQPIHGICLSGYGTDADLQQSRDAGYEHHLVKPVDLASLRRAINEIFDSAASATPAGSQPATDVRS